MVRTYIVFISIFWLGVAVSLLNYKKMENIFSLKSKYKLLKARTIIKGEPAEMGKHLLECFK
jgi:hypothetical protein